MGPFTETSHLIPSACEDVAAASGGLALGVLDDGCYYLQLTAYSETPEGTAGHGFECAAWDPDENVQILIEGGQALR